MNSTSTALTDECSGALNDIEIVVLATFNTVLALASTFGNALILAAIYQVSSQRTVSNAFIVSLGVADFTVGLIMNPLWVVKSVKNIWESDNDLSTVIEVLTMQTIVATTFSLCSVSVDRYIAIANIRYNEIMTWNRVRSNLDLFYRFCLFTTCHHGSIPFTKTLDCSYGHYSHFTFNTHLCLLLLYTEGSSASD